MKEAPLKEYDRWETRFAEPGYLFGTEPNAFLAGQKGLLPKSGRALAVADGEGRNGVWLAQQGLDVVSLDFSPAAQAKARALAASRGVTIETVLADALDWSWPAEQFDVIAVIFTQFADPPERERMFAGIRSALRPGGLLLIEGYGPKQLQYGTGGPSKLENLYTRELLEGAFGDFVDVRITEYETEMSEGSRHTGMSALIDFTGRKK
jgi:SAM-dependent methyltransferase